MIKRIDLKFFKCFRDISLPLSPLTLLSGFNSSGKSSILQALALMHQTMRDSEWSDRLMLNGNVFKMGNVADTVDEVHGQRSFDISLLWKEKLFGWVLEGDRSEMSMKVKRVSVDEDSQEYPEKLRHLLPLPYHDVDDGFVECLKKLTYLTAERAGPRDLYPLMDSHASMTVGAYGEDAASLLFTTGDRQIVEGLELEGVAPTRFRQAEGWMKRFFPGCVLNIDRLPRSSHVFLEIKTSDDTAFHRPSHVGFGLTQVFPIVVAGVCASKGNLLMIENPEVHLHPSGQALMGEFLAQLASVGVQVIVESHSDHLLNGIRRSVKNQKLDSNAVSLYFFKQRNENDSQVMEAKLKDDGRIVDWPDGFFDQIDKDTNYLLGWE